MKPRPPTLREKKRYILSRIEPPGLDPDPKALYFSVLESFSSLFGDAESARMVPVVISCGGGYAIVRINRGYEERARIALATLSSVAEKRAALHPVATSGTILALRRRIARAAPREGREIPSLSFHGRDYLARRYPGQKVDLLEKGIKSQELLFLTVDDLEES